VLVEIALDSEVLKEMPHVPLWQYISFHRELIVLLLRNGVLVTTEDDLKLMKILLASGTIRAEVREGWADVFQRGRVENISALPFSRIEKGDLCAIKRWSREADVALLSADIFERLAEDSNKLSHVWPGIPLEIGRARAPYLTNALGYIRDGARVRVIRPGTNREEVATKHLTPFIERSSTVTLVDRYVGQHLIRESIGERDHRINAPEFLLAFLGRVMPPTGSLEILTEADTSDKVQHLVLADKDYKGPRLNHGGAKYAVTSSRVTSSLEEDIRRTFVAKRLSGVSTIDLYLLPEGSFTHDRHFHIRYQPNSLGSIVCLSAGLDRLDDRTLKAKDGSWVLTLLPQGEEETESDGYAVRQAEEAKLRARARARVTFERVDEGWRRVPSDFEEGQWKRKDGLAAVI
jgi:hypothetical protein